jgi:hypothetical protein
VLDACGDLQPNIVFRVLPDDEPGAVIRCVHGRRRFPTGLADIGSGTLVVVTLMFAVRSVVEDAKAVLAGGEASVIEPGSV